MGRLLFACCQYPLHKMLILPNQHCWIASMGRFLFGCMLTPVCTIFLLTTVSWTYLHLHVFSQSRSWLSFVSSINVRRRTSLEKITRDDCLRGKTGTSTSKYTETRQWKLMKNDQFKNCYYLWKSALLDQLVVFSSRCFDTVPALWSPPNAFGSSGSWVWRLGLG